MDYIWHFQQIRMEVYVGVLKNEVELQREKHPLLVGFFTSFLIEAICQEGNIGQ